MPDSWIVQPADEGLRLDKFLGERGRLESRTRAARAIERGKVFLNGREATRDDGARRLVAGDDVRVWMDRPGTSRRMAERPPRPGELPIIYEDDSLVVVNKPAGLLTVPLPRRHDAPSVQSVLQEHFRSKTHRRPLVVHRIDRDTSGLVLFASRASAQTQLKEQFRRHEAARTYLAIVYGIPQPSRGTWRDHLVWDDASLIQKATHPADPMGTEAICHYEVLEAFEQTSLLKVDLVTGRRNQIRLQARLRGHTLIGESRYVYGPETIRNVEFTRQALHAWRLRVVHPTSGHALSFEAPIPFDIAELMARLRSK